MQGLERAKQTQVHLGRLSGRRDRLAAEDPRVIQLGHIDGDLVCLWIGNPREEILAGRGRQGHSNCRHCQVRRRTHGILSP